VPAARQHPDAHDVVGVRDCVDSVSGRSHLRAWVEVAVVRAASGAVASRTPGSQQPVDGLGTDQRRIRCRNRVGYSRNGRVCGPPSLPWNEINFSNAQPSSLTGSSKLLRTML
jgi:hypothetical protein